MAFKRIPNAVFGARRELGLHHTKIFTQVQRPGFDDVRVVALYVFNEDGTPEIFEPFVRYVLESGRARSLAWQANAALAVGLLIDFTTANAAVWSEEEQPTAFAAFAEALVAGTVRRDGSDPSELYWPPRSVARAKYLLGAATAFGDWVAANTGTAPLNPWRLATTAERIALARQAEVRSQRSMLGYLGAHRPKPRFARSVDVQRRAPQGQRDVKAFPSTELPRLLKVGFARKAKPDAPYHRRVNLRDSLIALLLHAGGLRVSEVFHLYLSDVEPAPGNPESALVRVFHPEQGEAPQDYVDPRGRWIAADREEYLAKQWRLQPRTLLKGRFHAGWKNLYLTDASRRCAEVFWYPPETGVLFLELFNLYVRHVRCVRPKDCAHPYLFISERKREYGQPYTMAAFAHAHGRAMERLGYVPGKNRGTTAHAHRHAYGSALAKGGVDRRVIQRAMHHRSPWSQDAYTEVSPAEVSAALDGVPLGLRPDPFLSEGDDE